MSLDVLLTIPRDEPTDAERAIALLREHGFEQFAAELEARHDTGPIHCYEANITHNLIRMADAAGIYHELWRPEEICIAKAWQLIEPLTAGLELLRSDPARFEAYNAPNGWGTYKHFVPFVANYLSACTEYPDADVKAFR